MRHALFAASALCGLSAALPQMINVEAALAVPTPSVLGPKIDEAVPAPITYNQAAATQSAAHAVATGGVEKEGSISKRDVSDACALQPGGVGQLPGDGSVAAYKDINGDLRKKAQSVATPSGYRKEFTDEAGSTQQIGYLTYKNIEDGTYNVQKCADFCDSERFCLGFNIFYERDPKNNPAPTCVSPDAITNVKCSIFGYPVAKASATNEGQWREQFQVVIVGSNGYSKVAKPAASVPDFNAPTDLKAAINAPLIKKAGQDYDTYNGMRLFNDGPYDPALCAAACKSQTQFDKEHIVDANGEYKPCNFFNSYILTKNGVPLGTYCSLYTQSWDESYAVNTGYYYGDDVYAVAGSASYNATTPDSGKIVAVPS